LPANDYFREAQPAILRDHDTALGALRARGLTIHALVLSRVEEVPKLTQVLIQSDGSAYHEQYRGREDRYAQSFRDFVLPGREVRAPEYVAARQAKDAITAEWLRLFERVDVLITPGSPCVANPHGVWEVELGGTPRTYRMAVTQYTRPWNLAGFPAIALPAGVTPEGLPTSVQLVAPPFAEARLLAVAHALEAELGVAARLPIGVSG
jgi:aspartyl-tRNA(Asn)/glutamyl-tRNA(Gln) amidotransferase subunit A